MEDDAHQPGSAEGALNLQQLADEDASLFALIRVLLSFATLPHVILILVLSVLLQLAAVNGMESTSAFGFLSLSGGYLLTGLLANSATVQRWIRLPEKTSKGDEEGALQSHASKAQFFTRLLTSFRICIFPMLMSGLVMVSLTMLVGENGSLGDMTSVLPWVLSSCFVVWAVVQGRGFGRWLTSVAASKLPESQPRPEGTNNRSAAVVLVVVLVLSSILLVVFEALAGGLKNGVGEALLRNALFLPLAGGLFALSWRRSQQQRLHAASRTDFHAFGVRWMMLSQVLITWHVLTVWRHMLIAPDTTLLMLEEFLLMMFTVVMAIWGLTSRSFRSSLKVVNTDNALPIGLAFGYAYAGSVAMLTTVLDDVKTVMMAGHIIVALTFLWMQPKVLRSTMGHAEVVERIQQVVEDATVATEPAGRDEEPHPPSEEVNSEDAEPDDAETDGSADQAIGENVEWKEPDVLATEVAWDDDEIELLD